jgi:hypothetical protein
MPYAILRTKKLKSFGEIGGSLAHTYRTRETPNADPARLDTNEHFGPEGPEAIQALVRDRLPAKRRSDAVLCIEYFIGASPEFFASDQDGSAYFRAAREWLVERHGADNVISTHVHRDETSPHLIAYVVPLDGERLNAKKWLGGRARLSEMQTDFAQAVGLEQGLERGEEGSVAQHQTIKDYYAKIQEASLAKPRADPPLERLTIDKTIFSTTMESDEQFAKRVSEATLVQVEPLIQKGHQAKQLAQQERAQAKRVGALTRALKQAEDRIRALEAPFEGLTHKDRLSLEKMIAATAGKMRQAARVITGWLRGIGQEREGEDWHVDVEVQGTGELRRMVSTKAAVQLNTADAKVGDLVAVSIEGGQVLQRARDRGPSR